MISFILMGNRQHCAWFENHYNIFSYLIYIDLLVNGKLNKSSSENREMIFKELEFVTNNINEVFLPTHFGGLPIQTPLSEQCRVDPVPPSILCPFTQEY